MQQIFAAINAIKRSNEKGGALILTLFFERFDVPRLVYLRPNLAQILAGKRILPTSINIQIYIFEPKIKANKTKIKIQTMILFLFCVVNFCMLQ